MSPTDKDYISGQHEDDFRLRLVGDLARLSEQVSRLASHVESEFSSTDRASGRLEKAIDISADNLKLELNKVDLKVNQIHDFLFVGSDSKPGLSTRLDRIEQGEAHRKKHIGLIWATILAMVGTFAAEYALSRLPSHNPAPTTVSTPAKP